jgi:purine-cytosine permease-like protein
MFGLLVPIVRHQIKSLIFNSLDICQVLCQILGAACAIAVPFNPSWTSGYAGGNVGGLLSAMLAPVGTFGKILVVFLALSVTSNIAATFYSATLNFQTAIPWLVVLPRYVLAIISTAM